MFGPWGSADWVQWCLWCLVASTWDRGECAQSNKNNPAGSKTVQRNLIKPRDLDTMCRSFVPFLAFAPVWHRRAWFRILKENPSFNTSNINDQSATAHKTVCSWIHLFCCLVIFNFLLQKITSQTLDGVTSSSADISSSTCSLEPFLEMYGRKSLA